MIDFPGAVVMDRAGFVGANMPEDYGSAKRYTRNIHAVPDFCWTMRYFPVMVPL